jgi:hypothetical protein
MDGLEGLKLARRKEADEPRLLLLFLLDEVVQWLAVDVARGRRQTERETSSSAFRKQATARDRTHGGMPSDGSRSSTVAAGSSTLVRGVASSSRYDSLSLSACVKSDATEFLLSSYSPGVAAATASRSRSDLVRPSPTAALSSSKSLSPTSSLSMRSTMMGLAVWPKSSELAVLGEVAVTKMAGARGEGLGSLTTVLVPRLPTSDDVPSSKRVFVCVGKASSGTSRSGNGRPCGGFGAGTGGGTNGSETYVGEWRIGVRSASLPLAAFETKMSGGGAESNSGLLCAYRQSGKGTHRSRGHLARAPGRAF